MSVIFIQMLRTQMPITHWMTVPENTTDFARVCGDSLNVSPWPPRQLKSNISTRIALPPTLYPLINKYAYKTFAEKKPAKPTRSPKSLIQHWRKKKLGHYIMGPKGNKTLKGKEKKGNNLFLFFSSDFFGYAGCVIQTHVNKW